MTSYDFSDDKFYDEIKYAFSDGSDLRHKMFLKILSNNGKGSINSFDETSFKNNQDAINLLKEKTYSTADPNSTDGDISHEIVDYVKNVGLWHNAIDNSQWFNFDDYINRDIKLMSCVNEIWNGLLNLQTPTPVLCLHLRRILITMYQLTYVGRKYAGAVPGGGGGGGPVTVAAHPIFNVPIISVDNAVTPYQHYTTANPFHPHFTNLIVENPDDRHMNTVTLVVKWIIETLDTFPSWQAYSQFAAISAALDFTDISNVVLDPAYIPGFGARGVGPAGAAEIVVQGGAPGTAPFWTNLMIDIPNIRRILNVQTVTDMLNNKVKTYFDHITKQDFIDSICHMDTNQPDLFSYPGAAFNTRYREISNEMKYGFNEQMYGQYVPNETIPSFVAGINADFVGIAAGVLTAAGFLTAAGGVDTPTAMNMINVIADGIDKYDLLLNANNVDKIRGVSIILLDILYDHMNYGPLPNLPVVPAQLVPLQGLDLKTNVATPDANHTSFRKKLFPLNQKDKNRLSLDQQIEEILKNIKNLVNSTIYNILMETSYPSVMNILKANVAPILGTPIVGTSMSVTIDLLNLYYMLRSPVPLPIGSIVPAPVSNNIKIPLQQYTLHLFASLPMSNRNIAETLNRISILNIPDSYYRNIARMALSSVNVPTIDSYKIILSRSVSKILHEKLRGSVLKSLANVDDTKSSTNRVGINKIIGAVPYKNFCEVLSKNVYSKWSKLSNKSKEFYFKYFSLIDLNGNTIPQEKYEKECRNNNCAIILNSDNSMLDVNYIVNEQLGASHIPKIVELFPYIDKSLSRTIWYTSDALNNPVLDSISVNDLNAHKTLLHLVYCSAYKSGSFGKEILQTSYDAYGRPEEKSRFENTLPISQIRFPIRQIGGNNNYESRLIECENKLNFLLNRIQSGGLNKNILQKGGVVSDVLLSNVCIDISEILEKNHAKGIIGSFNCTLVNNYFNQMLKYRKDSEKRVNIEIISSTIGRNRYIFDREKQEFYEIIGGERHYPHEDANVTNCLSSTINIDDPIECVQYITGCILNGNFEDSYCMEIFKKNALYGLTVEDMRKALNPNTALRILNAFSFNKIIKDGSVCYDSAYTWLKNKRDQEELKGTDGKKQVYEAFANNGSFMQYLQNLVEYVNYYKLVKRPEQLGGKTNVSSLFSKELGILEYNIKCGIHGPVSKIPKSIGYFELTSQTGGRHISQQEFSSEYIKSFLDESIRKLRSYNKNLTNETYSDIYKKLNELKSIENQIWNTIQKIQTSSRIIEKDISVASRYTNDMSMHDLEKLNAEYMHLLNTQRMSQGTLVKIISGLESIGLNAIIV